MTLALELGVGGGGWGVEGGNKHYNNKKCVLVQSVEMVMATKQNILKTGPCDLNIVSYLLLPYTQHLR